MVRKKVEEKTIPARAGRGSFATLLPTLPHPLFGREMEVRSFSESLSRRNLFGIQGMAGIGKTYFMSYLAWHLNETPGLERFRGKTFFFEVKDGWQSQTFIDQLFLCMKKTGAAFPLSPESDLFEPFSEKVMNILAFLNTDSYAIFIDDFHFFSRESQLELLLPFLKYLRTSKIIFSSCADIPLPATEKLGMWEIRLKALEAGSTISLFREYTATRDQNPRKPDDRELQVVHVRTGGHPFTIKLLASVYLSSRQELGRVLDLSSHYSREVRSFLMKRVFETLTETEKHCLELFLCLRVSIDPVCLEQDLDASFSQAIQRIRDKLLLDQTPDGKIRLHSIIREHGNELVQAENFRHHQAWWASFFRRRIDSGPPRLHGALLIEYVFHLIMAGLTGEAVAAMEDFLIDMYLQGRFDEMMSLFQMFQEKGVSLSPRMLISKAKILYLQGKWAESQILLEGLRKTAAPEEQPQILLCLGNIEVCRDRVQAAIDWYHQSHELAERFHQPGEQAEAHFNLGDSFFHLRQYEKALASYQRSRRLCEEIHDSDGMTDALMKKALVFQTIGKLSEAREMLGDSVRGYGATHNILGLGEAQLHLASLAHHEKDFPAASRYLEQSMSIFSEQRNVLKVLFLKILQGKILYFQERKEESWRVFSEALRLAAEYEQADELADSAFYLARIRIDRGEYGEALDHLGSFGSLYDAAIGARLEILKSFALALRGEFSPALKAAEEALNWLQSNKESPLYFLADSLQKLLRDSRKAPSLLKEINLQFRRIQKAAWPETSELERYLPVLGDLMKSPQRKVFTGNGEQFETSDTIAAWKRERTFDLLFDLADGRVFFDDTRIVDLREKPRLSRLLEAFMRNPGRRFRPRELYQLVWEQEFEVEIHDSNVRSHISRLRQVIEPGPSTEGFTYILKPAGQNEYFFNPKVKFCLVFPEEDRPLLRA